MQPLTGTLLIARDIGAGWGCLQADALARSLKSRLNQPVVLSVFDNSASGIADDIEALVSAGVRRVVALPLGLLPLPNQGAFPLVLARARRQWPEMAFHAAQSLSWLEWSRWLAATATEAVRDQKSSATDAALLLVGHGTSDPMVSADLARVAQLVRDSSAFALVEHAYIDQARPAVSDAIASIIPRGLYNIVVLPWMLAETEIGRSFAKRFTDPCCAGTLGRPLSHLASGRRRRN